MTDQIPSLPRLKADSVASATQGFVRPRAMVALLMLVTLTVGGGWLLARWRRSGNQHLTSGSLKGVSVLLVTIDTLRADHLGSYGSTAGLTPSLDRLATEGLRFGTAYAHVPFTLPSHAALMTAQYPTVNGVRDNGTFRLGAGHRTIATTLKQAGYETAAFAGAFPLDARFGLNQGFDLYDDYYGEPTLDQARESVERPASKVTSAALAWIESRRGRWFAWVHVYDPHEPYAPPEPYRSRYASDPYSGEVAYTDAALGRFFDALRTERRLDNTLVIVAADHGEGLGDHGERTHGLFAYNSTMRVPLILWSQGRIVPGVFGPAVRLIDVMPSILDLLGAPIPPELDGRSVRPFINGEASASDVSSYFEALNANFTRNWAPLTGIVIGNFKLIELPVPELYDLESDPNELVNVYTRMPGVVRRLGRSLDEVTRSAGAPKAAPIDADTEARLRSLGYVVRGTDRSQRAFTARDDPKNLVTLNNKLDEASAFVQGGQTDHAIALVQSVIADRPDFTLAYDRLAYMQRQRGQLSEAIATLERAARLGAADAALLRSLGTYQREAGSLKESASVLETVVRMNPDDVEGFNQLGVTYTTLGRVLDAERMFQTVLSADSSSASALNNLGSLYLSVGRVHEARGVLDRALTFDPDLASARNGLGVAYARMGMLPKAIEQWTEAIRLNPTQFDTLYNLGTALLRLGRRDEALVHLTRFQETAPPARYAKDIARVRVIIAEIRRRKA